MVNRTARYISPSFFLTALLLIMLLSKINLVEANVKTDIKVQAVVANTIQIYLGKEDYTNKTTELILKEASNGYLSGETKDFFFIGNIDQVTLTLGMPAKNELTSENDDKMEMSVFWIRNNKTDNVKDAPILNKKVFTSIDKVESTEGIKIYFRSAQKAIFLPLGTYSGTYTLTVTPKS